MHRRSFLSVAAACAIASIGGAPSSIASDTQKITGPFTHDNLAVYFIHGPSSEGPVPLTLEEALAKGKAHVYETGQVNNLSVENNSEEAVFVQAGDIVKGGQQDRVLTVSLLLQPQSGRVPIASFCVEQGRWSARGIEDVKRFSSAAEALPSREAKLALKQAASGDTAFAPSRRSALLPETTTSALPNVPEQRRQAGVPPRDGQSEIWNRVQETQRKLSNNLSAMVASPQSATSLQLTLENQKVQEARAAYAAALKET